MTAAGWNEDRGSIVVEGRGKPWHMRWALDDRRLELVQGHVGVRPMFDIEVDLRGCPRFTIRSGGVLYDVVNLPVHDHFWTVGCRSGWEGAFVEFSGWARGLCTFKSGSRELGLKVTLPIRRLVRRLHERLDPSALDVARAFDRSVRLWVYAHVAGDASGRIGQLARVCPGALLLANHVQWTRGMADWPKPPPAPAIRVLEDAVAGLPLRALVQRAVEDHAELLDVPGDADTLRRRFQLVKRAGPLVHPPWIVDADLPAYAPEDVPGDPVRNRRWFGIAACAAPVFRPLPEPLRAELSRFVSRHALRIRGWMLRRLPPEQRGRGSGVQLDHRPFRDLALHVLRTGRAPDLRTNPVAVLERAERDEARSPVRNLAALLDRVRTLGLGDVTAVERLIGSPAEREPVVFPPAPVGPALTGFTAAPVADATALAAEATEMQHCVATLLPALLAGAVFVYSARVGERRITVAVEPTGGSPPFRLYDAKAARNGALTAHERTVVTSWVASLQPRVHCGTPSSAAAHSSR